MTFGDIYRGKRVLLTGHTGFKGAWMAEWLLRLGAVVTGYALPPPTSPALFKQLGLADRMDHIEGDVRDLGALCAVIERVKPTFVFHLAAQPLVRLSYQIPSETYEVNVMGTVNLLEAIRRAGRRCAVVIVTTDKCYENKEWVHSYREEDPMGGYDPYSSSKGAAELVVAAYRRSFFSRGDAPARVASGRAGNVIGGGDWALDRIVPDCMRSLAAGEAIPVRNKVATRPWQHVLEPLSGYLWLGALLQEPTLLRERSPSEFSGPFNFGPSNGSNRAVAELVVEILKHWSGEWKDMSDPHAFHEAKLLNLSTDKAFHFLRWEPVWDFKTTVAQTVSWYRDIAEGTRSVQEKTVSQIAAYETSAKQRGLSWAGYCVAPASAAS